MILNFRVKKKTAQKVQIELVDYENEFVRRHASKY